MAVEKRQSECQYIHFMSPRTDPWSHLYPPCEGGDLHRAGVVARAAAVEVGDVPLLAQPLAEIIELHHDGGLHHLQPGLCRCTVPTCGHRGQQRGIDQAAVIPLAGRCCHAARETFQHSAPFLHPPNPEECCGDSVSLAHFNAMSLSLYAYPRQCCGVYIMTCRDVISSTASS